jgi:hypothetical protein
VITSAGWRSIFDKENTKDNADSATNDGNNGDNNDSTDDRILPPFI